MSSLRVFAENALAYISRGFSVIPFHREDKGPMIKGWNRFCVSLPSQEQLEEWFVKYENANIGICCGPQSNIVAFDMDLDSETEFGWQISGLIKDLIPQSPVEKKGKKGFSRFFKFSGEPSIHVEHGGQPAFDILSNYRQIIIPPSIHPETGRPFEWSGRHGLLDINPDDLPTLNWDHIEKIKKTLSEVRVP